jgi:hypothetical protein
MWNNKSQVLLVKLRTREKHGKKAVRFTIPLSLFVLQELLDTWEPLARLFMHRNGKHSEWKHMGAEYLEIGGRFLRELRGYGRMDIVDVESGDGDRVKVSLY